MMAPILPRPWAPNNRGLDNPRIIRFKYPGLDGIIHVKSLSRFDAVVKG